MDIEALKPGDVLTNAQIVSTFKCGNMGGMRKSNETQTLVLISDTFKGLYEDRWVEDVLHYTGMGKNGDQVFEGNQNKTLADSAKNGIGLHLFEVFSEGKYTYRGRVKLSEEPYQEAQPDVSRVLRKVWVFPLQLEKEGVITLDDKALNEKFKTKLAQAKKYSDEELKKRAALVQGAPSKRRVVTTQYERNVYVEALAKRKAAGICSLCKNPAPFLDKNGEPYLESHHIVWLSEGGPDTIENTIALCPNCHRKMHALDEQSEFDLLRNLAEQRAQEK